jgi:hypothetical protein
MEHLHYKDLRVTHTSGQQESWASYHHNELDSRNNLNEPED